MTFDLDIGPCVTMQRVSEAARFVLRSASDNLELLEAAWESALPRSLMQSTETNGSAALCLGPDEWLLIDHVHSSEQISARFNTTTLPLHSLVDVSHRQCAIELTGSGTRDLLATGCPLDLDPNVFNVGQCTRTLFGKCEIILWRRKRPDRFRLEFWRSFNSYMRELLLAPH